MEPWMLILGGAAVVVFVVAAMLVMRTRQGGKKQTKRLQAGFGPEYAATVDAKGRSGGEEDLMKREQRAELFSVRALSADDVSRYHESWTATQARFLDEPDAALVAADRLVGEVLGARGYPTGDFEQTASAVSVDHPRAVQEYRLAHAAAARNQRTAASPDELRAAFLQYRSVFTELLDPGLAATPVAAGPA